MREAWEMEEEENEDEENDVLRNDDNDVVNTSNDIDEEYRY